MDRDLINVALDEVKTAAGDAFKFPESMYKHIAFRMVRENCLGNQEWLQSELKDSQSYIDHKRGLAEKGEYQPFTFMGKSAYNWIRKNCAEWVLPAMEECFRDPEDIHPEWAVQCAKAMSVIGKDECVRQDNIYEFITNHPEWEIQKDAREQYRREWMRLKKAWERKHSEPRRRNNSPRRRPESDEARPRAESSPREHHPQAKDVGTDVAPMHQNLVTAQSEVVLKFETLPKGRPAYDRQYTNFELLADGRVVTVEIKRGFYDKLIKTEREGKKWIAVLSGQMGDPTAQGFLLTRPFARIYPVRDEQVEGSHQEQQSSTSQQSMDSPEASCSES